jgi:DNA-binding NtrC family response regulator
MRIFVVEDDPVYGKVLSHHLSLNPDNEVVWIQSGQECIKRLPDQPDLITLDYSLPDLSGLEVLKKIKSTKADTKVIVISGQEKINTAISLLHEGAYDYIVKGDDTKERLWNVVNNLRESVDLKKELNQLKSEVQTKYEFSNSLKGNSPALKNTFGLMEKAARTNITVSVTGETGTGKELVARAIHYNSLRKNKPFIAVNIAAIPDTLIESELFGHEKGSFTDAYARRIGKFEEANGGTIFLDEIGEMDIQMQAKLLRVLQEREITRIGGNKIIPIDVRVIVATNKDLSDMVRRSKFREDLYYRLLGLPIELAPLRERGNDVIILAKYFLESFASENGMGEIQLSTSAQNKLSTYLFPGNIRELKAVMELSAVMSANGTIGEDDIQFNSTSDISELFTKEKSLREYQISIIKHFMNKYNRDIDIVAHKLKIGKSTIYRMIQNKELTV